MCHNESTVGEEDSGKLLITSTSLENSEPCLWFLLRLKSSVRRCFIDATEAGDETAKQRVLIVGRRTIGDVFQTFYWLLLRLNENAQCCSS